MVNQKAISIMLAAILVFQPVLAIEDFGSNAEWDEKAAVSSEFGDTTESQPQDSWDEEDSSVETLGSSESDWVSYSEDGFVQGEMAEEDFFSSASAAVGDTGDEEDISKDWDPTFKSAVISSLRLEEGAPITQSMCEETKDLRLGTGEPSFIDLSPLKYFVNLEGLGLNNRTLDTIDLSYLPNLKQFNARNNNFTSVDFSNNTKLESLDLGGNSSLRSIDVSMLENLTFLDLGYTNLTELNVTNNPKLEYLRLRGSKLSVLDLSNNGNLIELDLAENQFKSEDDVHISYTPERYTFDPQKIDITADFTDPNFLAAVRDWLEKGDDEPIYTTDAANQGWLDVSGRNISSLDGIEHFTNLRGLNVSDNPLGQLDVSNLHFLEWLNCWNCELDSLNVGGCPELNNLNCSDNPLGQLDVSNLQSLEWLNCWNCELDSLNVDGCSELRELDCSENELSSLDVSSCTNLRGLWCRENQLTSLNTSGLSSLEDLYCGGNSITNLDLSDCNSLTRLSCEWNRLGNLDLSNCPLLLYLDCGGNYTLSSLDLSHLAPYDEERGTAVIRAETCRLTSINLSGADAIEELYLRDNRLTEIDLTDCTNLTYLELHGNQLTEIDLTNCTKLHTVLLYNNQLTELDFTKNPDLEYFDIDGNNIRELDLRQNPNVQGESWYVNNYLTKETLKWPGEDYTDFDRCPQRVEISFYNFDGEEIECYEERMGNSFETLNQWSIWEKGKTPLGWATSKDAKEPAYGFNQWVEIPQDVSPEGIHLYPVYEDMVFNVRYQVDDETTVDVKKTYGTTLEVKELKEQNLDGIRGWSLNEDTDRIQFPLDVLGDDADEIFWELYEEDDEEEFTLYPVKGKYTVTYKANGHPDYVVVYDDDELYLGEEFSDIDIEELAVTYWVTDDGTQYKADRYITLTGDLVLTAKFVYEIHYNDADGKLIDWEKKTDEDAYVTIKDYQGPSVEGKVFRYWISWDGQYTYYPGDSVYTGYESMYMNAFFDDTYIISYYVEGELYHEDEKPEGESIRLTEGKAVSGKTFLGWATTEGKTSPDYQAGGVYSDDRDLTLYAVYSVNTTPETEYIYVLITPTATPSPTPTPSPTATPSATPTPSPTATPSATPTPSPTATPSATPTPTPTATPVPATPTPIPIPVSKPKVVTSTAHRGEGTITLNYLPAKGATAYEYGWKEAGTKGYTKETTSFTTATASGLKPDGIYLMRLRGLNATSAGKYTYNRRWLHTVSLKLSVDKDKGKGTIKITITDQGNQAGKFVIKVATDREMKNLVFKQTVTKEEIPQMTYTVEDLKSDMKYYVRVCPYVKVNDKWYRGIQSKKGKNLTTK